jgi:predicted tellurium resistance membrane protein TerC
MPELLDIILSLLTLTILEVILGIDNLVFLAIISQKLPRHQRKRARQIGLTLAWVLRLLFLASALWLTKLVHPLFYIFSYGVSPRNIFLFIGGLFLIAKATQEIHHELEVEPETKTPRALQGFLFVISQIAVLDIIFSLDSILTAIGLTHRYWLMALAITIAIIVMIVASNPLSEFVERHPTIKMLALSFLILIGMVLVADSLDFHIPRGYIYFAMAFSLSVEFLNLLRGRKKG